MSSHQVANHPAQLPKWRPDAWRKIKAEDCVRQVIYCRKMAEAQKPTTSGAKTKQFWARAANMYARLSKEWHEATASQQVSVLQRGGTPKGYCQWRTRILDEDQKYTVERLRYEEDSQADLFHALYEKERTGLRRLW